MTVSQHIRPTFRALTKEPGFVILSVFTLALGIGANTAIFTLINSLLLRPLPFRDPRHLVLVNEVPRNQHNVPGCFSYPHYQQLQQESRGFAGIAAFSFDVLNLTKPGDAEQLAAARVSWNFFKVLGVRPYLGRSFQPEDDSPGARPAVLISDELWSRRFRRRADIVGFPVTLNANIHTILGVLPRSFEFGFIGNQIDVWAPQIDQISLLTPPQARGGVCYLNAVARLGPGMSLVAAQSQMDVLQQRFARESARYTDADPRNIILLSPLQEQLTGSLRPTLFVLWGAVGLVLLISCANVAGLLVSRSLARKKEFAVRLALGASRGDVIVQLLMESIALALAGGVAGTFLALAAVRGIGMAAQKILPRTVEMRDGIDVTVLLFSFGISILSGILFGLTPAFQISRTRIAGVLREEGHGSIGSRHRNLARSALVVGQLALSITLLVGSGLLIRSFIRLQTQPLGFEPHRLMTMNISLPPAKYASGVQMTGFFQELLSRVRALPGVVSATTGSALPANPLRYAPILAEGQPKVPFAERPVFPIQMVMDSYLKTMAIPLIAGREFSAHDTAKSPAVALVNLTFARRFFRGQNVVGKHLLLGRKPGFLEIVGVTGDVRNVGLASVPSPEVFVPFAQLAWPSLNLVIRTAGDPHAIVNAVRYELRKLDADQPVTAVQSMEEVLSAARSQPRLMMILLGIFAGCALILSVVGLYGVISHSVRQRTAELGVRMALGADRNNVLFLVISHGFRLAVMGIAIGLTLSFALTRAMSSLVYQVTTTDPVTFVLAPVLFLMCTIMATYFPANRATLIDPIEALRSG